MDPTGTEALSEPAAEVRPGTSRRALLALCLTALGLAACEEGYWDPDTGQFRIPFERTNRRYGGR